MTYARAERDRANAKGDKNSPTLYLVRHGHTALNSPEGGSPDRIRGWVDIPLDDRGEEAADGLAKFFKGKGCDCIYTSDLIRALSTAGEISEELEIPIDTVTEELRPWNLGKFQGTDSEIAQPAIEKFSKSPNEVVPEGESFNSFKRRFVHRLVDMMKDAHDETIIAVTHFRDMKLTQALLDEPKSEGVIKSAEPDLDVFLSNDLKEAAVMKLTLDNGKWSYNIERQDNG